MKGARADAHALTQPLDIARFAGEAAIDARLVDGATRDFNLMVRRGAATGELEVWRSEGAAATQHHRLVRRRRAAVLRSGFA